MSWGIPGNVGEIYRKQQSDELKDQLLQQTLAQRIREFQAEQEDRRAKAEEQRQLMAERAKASERQTSLDLEKQLGPGAITPGQAAVLRPYPATAARLSTARLDPAFGTPPIDVLAPTPEQAAKASKLKEDEAQKAGLIKIIGGLPQGPTRRAAEYSAAGGEHRPAQEFETQDERTAREAAAAAARDKEMRDSATFREGLIRGRPDRTGGGGAAAAPLPGDLGALIGRAMGANFPANRRPAVIAQAKQYLDNNDREGLKEWIVQTAIETEGMGARDQITGRRQAARALSDIRGQLQQLQKAGVNMNLLTGTVEDTAQKLGTSSDPRLARLGNQMKDSFINYRRSMTGVAFGQAEGQEYASMAPDYSKTLPLNEAKISGLLDAMASRDAEFWERKLGKAGAQLVGVMPETGAATPGAPAPPPTGAPRIEYDAQGNRKQPRK